MKIKALKPIALGANVYKRGDEVPDVDPQEAKALIDQGYAKEVKGVEKDAPSKDDKSKGAAPENKAK